MTANWELTKTGEVRAICWSCDRRSKPVDPRPDARPTSWELYGWSSAPYPIDCENVDGSVGPKFTCPRCKRLRDDRDRRGVTPLLSPSTTRAAAIQARRRG